MSPMLNINPIPWGVLVLAGGILGGLVLYSHAYNAGKTACEAAAKVQLNEHLSRAIEQANRQNAEDALILRAASSKQHAIRAHTQTLIKEVSHYVAQNPVYDACELDACGLCLAQSAARGDDFTRCPCGFAAGVPRAAGFAERDDGRFAANLYRDGGVVPRVPRTTAGINSMGGGR